MEFQPTPPRDAAQEVSCAILWQLRHTVPMVNADDHPLLPRMHEPW